MPHRLLTFALCICSFMLSAQDNWEHIKVIGSVDEKPDTVKVDLYDTPEFSEKELERAIPSLKSEYSGFAIELITSEHLLSRNNPALSGFGQLFIDQYANKYRYLFPVEYHRRKSVKQFYRKIVKPKAPNSKVVQYLNGVRTTEFSW